MTPSRPKHPPAIPESERLEEVRAAAGVPSLRQFWQRLSQGLDEPDTKRISYEAVRKYHHNRVAPAFYSARVADVFGVSLLWLVTGKGPMWERERREVLDKADRLMREARGWFFTIAKTPSVAALDYLLSQVQYSLPGDQRLGLSAEQIADLGVCLIDIASAPFVRLFQDPGPDNRQTVAYFQLVFQAMALIIPANGKGLRYEELMERLREQK